MRTETKIVFVLALGVCLYGCDTGEAPKGLSSTETQAAVSALPAQQQIDYINKSPMSPAEKEQRISAIKAKAGIK